MTAGPPESSPFARAPFGSWATRSHASGRGSVMDSAATKERNGRASGVGIRLLLIVACLLGAASPSFADDCVADLGGLIDGNVTPVPPSQIQIDGNCTIRNFPASNPLTTNFSFLT